MSDVPEADKQEQAEEVDPGRDTAREAARPIPDDAPEADVLEQAEEVPDDDDEHD